MTSGKSLLNVPEPWFPHLKRGERDHKRSFGVQDILVYKGEEIPPLAWNLLSGLIGSWSLVSLLSLLLLCTRASRFLFKVQGGIK